MSAKSSNRIIKTKRTIRNIRKVPTDKIKTETNTYYEKNPDVIVDFEYDNGLLSIIIENIGNDPAYDTTIRFNKKIWGMQKTRDISSLDLFQSLRFLPPGKKIKTLIDSFQYYLAYKQPMNIDTHISFRNKTKQSFQNLIHHDLSVYKDIVEVNSIKKVI